MGKPFSPSQHAAVKLRVSEMYRSGMQQSEIAAAIIISKKPISQVTVSRFIKELLQDWYHEGVFNVNQAKLDELHKINALELTYRDAWFRSIGNKKETVELDRDGFAESGAVNITEKKTKKWRDVGDPRYLAGIQWCIEQRAKLLGLYEEIKVGGSAFNSLSDWVRAITENANKTQ